MTNDIDAREYFLARRPESGPKRMIYSRIANAMHMRGDITMNQLCEMTDKELKRVRYIGDKARVVVVAERERYLKEKNNG